MSTLDNLNNWCRANGISVSLCQDSQRSAKDMLDELLTVGNSAPVYSGDTLKIIPYDEVSSAGNGAVYVAPTASGPIADLTDKDFATDKQGQKLPLKFTRKKRTDCDNVVAIEHIDRNLDYSHNTTSECDQKAVAMYGPRKGGALDAADLGINNPSGSKAILSIHSAEVAQKIGSILAKRGAAGVNRYEFALNAEWFYLEAMDLVTITDERLGLNQVPVRLVSVKETSDRTIECVADQFIYGLNHPDVKETTAATGTLVTVNVDPDLVNTPIIFEPTLLMLSPGTSPQIWFLVSGDDQNYGGCVGYVSVDGGNSYTPMGNIGPATMGVLTADYPVGSDPDTTNTLAVDLSESHGEIASEPQSVADGFANPCYVDVLGASSDSSLNVFDSGILNESTQLIQPGTVGNTGGGDPNAPPVGTYTAGNPAVFHVEGTTAFDNAYWYKKWYGHTDIKYVVHKMKVRLPTTGDRAACRCIEWEMQKSCNGRIFNMAWQANFAGSQWRTFTKSYPIGTGHWDDSGITFDGSIFDGGAWVDLEDAYLLTDTTVTHLYLKINGVTNTVNITRTAPLHTESNYITAAFQLDEDGNTPPTPYDAEVKEWTVNGFRGDSLAYEVVCPTVSTLTSAENYSLTTYTRRAVQGTTAMLHPVGSNFGVLDAATFKVDLPTQWIGITLWFKFPAYNKMGGQQNTLDQCVAYPFTPQGIVGSFDVSVDNIGISHDFIASIDSAGPYIITGA